MTIKEIAMDTAILQTDIKTSEGALAIVKSKTDNMFEHMRELNKMWEGTANQAFMAQFDKDYLKMKEICTMLEKLLANIKLAGKEYDTCENSINTVIKDIQIEET